jgi:hypothetical protein
MVGIFCGWGFCPAELPEINFLAKPDRFPYILLITISREQS